MAYVETEARIKGGMPVYVSADMSEGGYYNLVIRWFKTGKVVTDNFFRSISKGDIERIWEALEEERRWAGVYE